MTPREDELFRLRIRLHRLRRKVLKSIERATATKRDAKWHDTRVRNEGRLKALEVVRKDLEELL